MIGEKTRDATSGVWKKRKYWMIAIMDLRGKLVGHGSPGFHFVKTALTLFFMTENNRPWAFFSEIYAIAAEVPIDNFFMIHFKFVGRRIRAEIHQLLSDLKVARECYRALS